MKRILIYILPIILPLALLITVNEYSRGKVKERPYFNSLLGISAINSAVPLPYKCTWYCAFNTYYCKRNHVKYLKPYFKYVDPIYFGIIALLMKTGNYVLANIIFLVIIWPLFMYYLLVKSLLIQHKLKEMKDGNG
jgi:hypothetical protein